MGESELESDLKKSPQQLESSNSNCGIKWMQAGLCLLLCALICVLGFWFYSAIRNEEISKFKSQFLSASTSIRKSVTEGFERKVSAASLVNHMYANAIANDYGGTFPNLTIPGFEGTMRDISSMSGLRLTSFSPLITAETRPSWEAYAAANVHLLHGPSYLNTSTNGSWVIADGIFTVVDRKKVKSSNYISDSLYPTALFPIWQSAPIALTGRIIMLEPHGLDPNRMKTIDAMISTKKVAFSDMIQLVSDGPVPRPSTLMIGPIQTLEEDAPVVGYMAGGFSWDDVLSGTLSVNYDMDCVISTSTASYTYRLFNSSVSLIGAGDHHDHMYDSYKTSFSPFNDYEVVLYPTNQLYYSFVTNSPRNSCIVVVFLIAFTAFLVLLYSHLVKQRELMLLEAAKYSYANAASRDAVLLAKKVYVRYISHEIRTPLNAAYLGLKILEKEILKEKHPNYSENLTIVKDIVDACDIAVAILNDLLNYDKLEDGTLTIEPKKTIVIPFIISCVNLFLLPAEEKNIQLIFDLTDDDNDRNDPQRKNINETTMSVDSDTHFNNEKITSSTMTNSMDMRKNNHNNNNNNHNNNNINNNNNNHNNNNNDNHININCTNSNNSSCPTISDFSNFLSPFDCIDVDEHKMSQVIRNLISNAIKFTPDGQSVTIKIRKINPVQGIEKHVKRKSFTDTFDTFKSVIHKKMASSFTSQSCSNSMAVNRKNLTDNYPNDIENNIHVSNNDSNDKNEDNFLWRNYYKKLPKFQNNNNKHEIKENKLYENGVLYNCDKLKKNDISGKDNDQIVYDQSKHIYGTLIIDIIDSGVGMALEDANRLFKEIVQFNPGELQAGGGSGLGMVITKALVDLHDGEVSVFSAGKGHGSVFTLKLPLTSPFPVSRSSLQSLIKFNINNNSNDNSIISSNNTSNNNLHLTQKIFYINKSNNNSADCLTKNFGKRHESFSKHKIINTEESLDVEKSSLFNSIKEIEIYDDNNDNENENNNNNLKSEFKNSGLLNQKKSFRFPYFESFFQKKNTSGNSTENSNNVNSDKNNPMNESLNNNKANNSMISKMKKNVNSDVNDEKVAADNDKIQSRKIIEDMIRYRKNHFHENIKNESERPESEISNLEKKNLLHIINKNFNHLNNSNNINNNNIINNKDDNDFNNTLNLLVVDDSKLNRRMLIKLLSSDDHICDEAEDGFIAVEKVKKRLNPEDYLASFRSSINSNFENDENKNELDNKNKKNINLNPNYQALNSRKENINGKSICKILHNEMKMEEISITIEEEECHNMNMNMNMDKNENKVLVENISPDIKHEKILNKENSCRISTFSSILPTMVPLYDAILMDFMMPRMDGPTATKLIRDLGFKGLIIGVTGNALPSDIEHFIACGADQVLIKPVNMDALSIALSNFGKNRRNTQKI